MSEVTISKEEYRQLKQQAKAYKKLTGHLFEFVVRDRVEDVVKDFRKTKLYTNEFIKELEDGLQKSSYTSTRK